MSNTGFHAIADDLRAAINSGRYRPGQTIPSLIELEAQYGVSKETIRRAIALLRAEGLVVPIRRRGTVVRDRTPIRLDINRYAATLLPGPGGGPWETACEQQGIDGHTEIVTVQQRNADAAIAEQLELPEGAPVIYRLAHMYAADVVGQIQETWLPLDLVDGTVLAGPDVVTGGHYRALTTIGHQPATARETVVARMPTRQEAETMQLDLGSPVLASHRVTRDHTDRVVIVTYAVVVGDRVQITYNQTFPRARKQRTRRGRQ